jgi:hypothetical protein
MPLGVRPDKAEYEAHGGALKRALYLSGGLGTFMSVPFAS